MYHEILPLNEKECSELFSKRYSEVLKSIEESYLKSIVSNEGTFIQRSQIEEDIFCSEELNAEKIQLLKNYYTDSSEENLIALVDNIGWKLDRLYSPLSIDFFRDILESKNTQFTPIEQNAYEFINMQARILNTLNSVWEKVLDDLKDTFAQVMTANPYTDTPDSFEYDGTLKIEKKNDDEFIKNSILNVLKEHNIPREEDYLKDWAEILINSEYMSVETPISTLNTNLIGMYLYEKKHLDEVGLNSFSTYSIYFENDDNLYSIEIVEDKDSYSVRSYYVKRDTDSSNRERDDTLLESAEMSLPKILSQLKNQLSFKEIKTSYLIEKDIISNSDLRQSCELLI